VILYVAAALASVFAGGLIASGFVVLVTLAQGEIRDLSYSLLTRMSLWAGAVILTFSIVERR
jgi:hypothetical protein